MIFTECGAKVAHRNGITARAAVPNDCGGAGSIPATRVYDANEVDDTAGPPCRAAGTTLRTDRNHAKRSRAACHCGYAGRQPAADGGGKPGHRRTGDTRRSRSLEATRKNARAASRNLTEKLSSFA